MGRVFITPRTLTRSPRTERSAIPVSKQRAGEVIVDEIASRKLVTTREEVETSKTWTGNVEDTVDRFLRRHSPKNFIANPYLQEKSDNLTEPDFWEVDNLISGWDGRDATFEVAVLANPGRLSQCGVSPGVQMVGSEVAGYLTWGVKLQAFPDNARVTVSIYVHTAGGADDVEYAKNYEVGVDDGWYIVKVPAEVINSSDTLCCRLYVTAIDLRGVAPSFKVRYTGLWLGEFPWAPREDWLQKLRWLSFSAVVGILPPGAQTRYINSNGVLDALSPRGIVASREYEIVKMSVKLWGASLGNHDVRIVLDGADSPVWFFGTDQEVYHFHFPGDVRWLRDKDLVPKIVFPVIGRATWVNVAVGVIAPEGYWVSPT